MKETGLILLRVVNYAIYVLSMSESPTDQKQAVSSIKNVELSYRYLATGMHNLCIVLPVPNLAKLGLLCQVINNDSKSIMHILILHGTPETKAA